MAESPMYNGKSAILRQGLSTSILGISKQLVCQEIARKRNVYEEIYDRARDPESRDPGAGTIAGSCGQIQRDAAPAWTGHSVAGILCCCRQNILCVSGQR